MDKKPGQGVLGWVQIALSLKLPSSAAAQPSTAGERAVLFLEERIEADGCHASKHAFFKNILLKLDRSWIHVNC